MLKSAPHTVMYGMNLSIHHKCHVYKRIFHITLSVIWPNTYDIQGTSNLNYHNVKMSWVYFIKLIIVFAQLPVNAKQCIEVNLTVDIVQECPQTQQAWKQAAIRKNCGGIQHSCTSFVYHCVMNTWRNKTVEVCAPQRQIVGRNKHVYYQFWFQITCIHLNFNSCEFFVMQERTVQNITFVECGFNEMEKWTVTNVQLCTIQLTAISVRLLTEWLLDFSG